MQIFENKNKKELLDSLEGLRRAIPLMDMDDRDFTAAVLYRMANIVREHGPSHGVKLDTIAIHPDGMRLGNFEIYPTKNGIAFGKVAECGEYNLESAVSKVIYAPPATIIYWKDGTKTVVKCSDQDLDEGRLSPETGLVYAIAKKVLGNKGNYNDVLRRLVKRAKKEE